MGLVHQTVVHMTKLQSQTSPQVLKCLLNIFTSDAVLPGISPHFEGFPFYYPLLKWQYNTVFVFSVYWPLLLI